MSVVRKEFPAIDYAIMVTDEMRRRSIQTGTRDEIYCE